jgi:alpha-amylase
MDGFRLDAIKHIASDFYLDWITELEQHAQRTIFVVGEYWSYHLESLTWYAANTGGHMSLFDAPLHLNFHQASRSGGHYDMRRLLDGTLMQQMPLLAVTLVDNHDTQPLQMLESVVEAWFKPLAYAVILLARGHCAYGPQYDSFDHFNTIGWTRLGSAGHPRAMAVLMSDGDAGRKWMEVGKRHTIFRDLTGHIREPITSNADGWAEWRCPGGSVSVWVEEEALGEMGVRR